jgi:5S rRNA maturation endonuclease (ribonuclease M5)
MEEFATISTAQELFKQLEKIPASLRARMQVIVFTDPDVNHTDVDVEAISVVEGGAEVALFRLTSNTTA